MGLTQLTVLSELWSLSCPSEENIQPGLPSTLWMLRDGALQLSKMQLHDRELHLGQESLLSLQVISVGVISLLGVCVKAARWKTET